MKYKLANCPECGQPFVKETQYCDFCIKDFEEKEEKKPHQTDWRAIGRELLRNRLGSGLDTYYNPGEVMKELEK